MPKIIKNNPGRVRKFIWWNIAIGIALFTIMFVSIVTGQYEDLTARTQAELLLNDIAIGGLLYAAFFFVINALSAPHLQSQK